MSIMLPVLIMLFRFRFRVLSLPSVLSLASVAKDFLKRSTCLCLKFLQLLLLPSLFVSERSLARLPCFRRGLYLRCLFPERRESALLERELDSRAGSSPLSSPVSRVAAASFF